MLRGVAVYSYRSAEHLEHLLWTIRNFGGGALPVVVAEDRDELDPDTTVRYAHTCARYRAVHLPLPEHRHMSGTCHAAVMGVLHETDGRLSDWILVCSDDVLLTRSFLPRLIEFANANPVGGPVRPDGQDVVMRRVAGIYLHHWDAADIEKMAGDGRLPELDGWTRDDFYAAKPWDDGWWLRAVGYELPEPAWSEPTPPDMAAVVSNVHGSAFVVRTDWWLEVGGTDGCATWQNDSLFSFRVGHWTDAFIIRVPGLPSVAHYGAGAPTPPDQLGRWRLSVWNLLAEHGYCYDPDRDRIQQSVTEGRIEDLVSRVERGLKFRAYSLQRRYERGLRRLTLLGTKAASG